jgi:ATP-dependent DNA helicase RecQ
MILHAPEPLVAYPPARARPLPCRTVPVHPDAEPALPANDDPLLKALQARFGLDSFRPWQREAIDAVLGATGRVLVVAPTGGGKSLTYQLPATILEGTTLVLSPLVALMEDQVRSLKARGIAATFLASTLDLEERRDREARLLRGEYALVYVAPERLASDAFVGLLAGCRIELVAVDEAHCIAQWGHDFRPDYLRIGALLERLAPPRVLACTATATPEVRAQIREQLGFTAGNCVEVLRGFARPNLHLAARSIDGPKEARAVLYETLASSLGEPRAPRGAAIVYAATRRATEQWADGLRERGWNARAYHAGMDAEARTRVASAFAKRKLDVVVATNAFGMGIDRGDIRAVVHVQPPASIESYYQEVGRAGRDGDEAHGLLLCSGADIALRRRLSQLGSEGGSADAEQAARAWDLFRALLRYLDARTCRHDFVLRYFGDEHELLGGCGHCDVCAALDDAPSSSSSGGGSGSDDDQAFGEPVSTIVRKALSGVARAQRRAGLQAIVDMLCGVDDDKTRRFGFTRLSTFGLLAAFDREWVVALLRALLAAGWVDLTTSDHPVPFVTRAGGDVMRGSAPARIVLPPRTSPSPRRAGRSESKKREPSREPAADLSEDDRALFGRLRAHRAEVARAKKVPAYVIAFDRTLAEVAQRRPRSLQELASVYGFGPSRIDQYGQGFLDVVAAG